MVLYLLAMQVAEATAVDPISPLLQYGALGVLAAVCVIAVRILFKRVTDSYDQEHARADRLEEQLNKQNATMIDQLIPALIKATAALENLERESRRGSRND